MGASRNATVPFLEELEGRLMLSATYTCGPTFIAIRGDSAAAATVTIADNGTSFTVTGATKTGTGTLPTLANANKVAVTYSTTNKADTFTYNAATVVAHPLMSLTYNGGSAADTVLVEKGVIKALTVNAGAGNNAVTVGGATVDVTGALNIQNGTGNYAVTLGSDASAGTQILGAITVNDTALAANTGTVKVETGTYGTVAHVTAPVTPATAFGITTGLGTDTVYFQGTQTDNGATTVSLKNKNDVLHLGDGFTTNALTFNSNVVVSALTAGATVNVANSATGSTVTFAKNFTTSLAGTSTLQLTGNDAGNSITVNGNFTSNFTPVAASTVNFNVGTTGKASTLTLNGAANNVNFGLAGAVTTSNINAHAIVLGAGSSTDIGVTATSRAVLSGALKTGLALGVQPFTGVIDGLQLNF